MDRKTLTTVTPDIRAAYKKAVHLPNENERLLALKDLVIAEPGFVEARSKLRDLERKKIMSVSGLSRFFARLGSPSGKVKSLTKNTPVKGQNARQPADPQPPGRSRRQGECPLHRRGSDGARRGAASGRVPVYD